MADTRTIAQVIAEIEAALARCEAMVEEMKGEADDLQEDAEASARARRRAEMRDHAECARAAMAALDEIKSALDGSMRDFMENGIGMDRDDAEFECGKRLQRSIGEARLALQELESCFGAADLGPLSLGENPSKERVLSRVSVAAAFFRELWRDLREGNPCNKTDASYHIAFSKEAVNAA